MSKFIISIKDKNTGRDVISPFTIDSLNGVGDFAERVASYGCLVIIDSIKEENDFFELSRKFELSKPATHE
jgi:predicted lactoylglutathione lyase